MAASKQLFAEFDDITSRFKQKTLRKTSCTAAAQTKEVMILYVIYTVLLDAKLCGGGNGIILNGLYVSFLMSCTDHAKTTTISARNAPQLMEVTKVTFISSTELSITWI